MREAARWPRGTFEGEEATVAAPAKPGRTLEEIREAALELEAEERAELAQEMLASLGSAEVSSEFARELERRIREVETGAVKPIPWAQVRAELEDLARGR
jgi:putative addiction module component (TIGR02574 family)